MRENSKKKGVTLTELLVVLGILIFILGLTIPAFRFFQHESALLISAEEIINILRLAQNKTLASEGESSWGVYFATATQPHQYTLFKGNNYISRVTSFDELRNISDKVEIYEINFSGGGSEVVFKRVSGNTNQSGWLSIRLKDDVSKNRKIVIQPSGQVVLGEETSPSDTDRIKDSRHVHFDYSLAIDTLSGKITLVFEGGVNREIIIKDNIKDGQIYWAGEVDVSGSIQRLKIQTHILNSPNSQFSIHRDMRYNNKALIVTISGDPSGNPPGNLIQYDASGQTTKGNSIYVSDPIWQ